MKKLLTSVLAAVMLFTFIPTKVFALDPVENNNHIINIYKNMYVVIIDGDIYEFEDESSYNLYLYRSRMRSGVEHRRTKISEQMFYYQWFGFHPDTPNWVKASHHTIHKSKNRSFSASISYQGQNVGVTLTYSDGVSSQIPVDSSRYSRLAIYGDVRVEKNRYDVYEYGTKTNTFYVTSGVVINRYIDPIYK